MLRRAPRKASLVAALIGAIASTPAEAANLLRVIPFPGTPDASPQSTIIFSALAPADISSVSVLGSRSGRHTGHLSVLPDHAGTAFLPDHPFTPGEHIQVSAALTSPQAGTASGAPNATHLNFGFTVALPGRAGAAAADSPHRGGRARSASNLTRTFTSMPDLHPPAISVSGHPDLGAGDILLTANHNSQPGPMILNGRGQLLWFRPMRHRGAFNLQVQRYRGQPVLTWWEGRDYFHGEDVVTSRSYRTVAIVRGAEGYEPDLHEFQIAPQGTALFDVYAKTRQDLSRLGGPKNGTVIDCIVFEVNIRTGQVLWDWHSLGHVPLSDSYYPAGSPGVYDYFHLNSIQQLPGGRLLISGKGTWAVYEISRRTGRIIWTLGGKHPSFRMGPGTRFEWQHDAHMVGRTVSVFDDADTPQEERQSSAKLLSLNTTDMTARLVHRYTHRPPALAATSGSVQTLANGHVFVGWGGAPYFSEYTASGRQIWNGSEALGLYSYRAFRSSWSGRPETRPALAVRRSGGTVTLFASWNGATGIATWRVLGGVSPRTLHRLGPPVSWSGFETVTVRHTALRYFAVQALGSHGHILGSSTPKVPTS